MGAGLEEAGAALALEGAAGFALGAGFAGAGVLALAGALAGTFFAGALAGALGAAFLGAGLAAGALEDLDFAAGFTGAGLALAAGLEAGLGAGEGLGLALAGAGFGLADALAGFGAGRAFAAAGLALVAGFLVWLAFGCGFFVAMVSRISLDVQAYNYTPGVKFAGKKCEKNFIGNGSSFLKERGEGSGNNTDCLNWIIELSISGISAGGAGVGKGLRDVLENKWNNGGNKSGGKLGRPVNCVKF